MAQQFPVAPFAPKQAFPRSPQLMKEFMGDSTLQVARTIVQQHVPMPPPGAKVHDNACGNGVITQALLEAWPEDTDALAVHATDIAAPMVQATESLVSTQGWTASVQTAVMNSEALDFNADFFDASFSNFIVHVVPNADKLVAEVYRTLKPGGIAMFNCWCDVVHDDAMLAAHDALRTPGTPHLLRSLQIWKQTEHLRDIIKAAGFKEVRLVQVETYVDTKDLRRWLAIGWSFLGAPVGGWVQADESNWEKAIDIMYEKMVNKIEPMTSPDGEEIYRLNIIANVALAIK